MQCIDFIARHSIPTLACSLAMQMYGKIEFLDLVVVLKAINSFKIIYLGQNCTVYICKSIELLLLFLKCSILFAETYPINHRGLKDVNYSC